MDSPISTSREDWINAARRILVEEGVGEVKILTLAQRLGCSRSNFYWFFEGREALLSALLAHWQGMNTAAIVERANRPATCISQGVLNIFDCWANAQLFDARLDFAVREWARRSDSVLAEVRRADEQRLGAIGALYARFGASPTQAMVRARTLYFMQIGYYALDIQETPADRYRLLRDYIIAFCGEEPSPQDLADFTRRNPPQPAGTAIATA